MTPDAIARLTRLRHELHQFPELSGQEQATAARVADELQASGATHVLTDIGGYGVAGIYDSGKAGPTVAIRCELDGLPIQETSNVAYKSRIEGKGHLCGHDGHMAMVLGVADHLENSRPQFGRVVLIFQPAEETGQGAIAYRADPKFTQIAPDYVFSLHNLPGMALGDVELCVGAANCASRGMKIVLLGKTSHASAPQDGVSPADALVSLMPKLSALAEVESLDADFALTTVTHANLGEPTFGVAPGRAELWVTLRTVADARMQSLMEDAEALVAQVASDQGLGFKIAYDDIFLACENAPEAVEILTRSCAQAGVPCKTTSTPQKFSEDFGQFSKGAKAGMFWLGSGTNHPQLHNPDYDFPDALIPIGTKVFLEAIQQVLGPINPQ